MSQTLSRRRFLEKTLGAGAALADTTVGWEPDANALGAVSFYDADGNQVTAGSLSDHPVVVRDASSVAGTVTAALSYRCPPSWSGSMRTSS